MEEKKNQDKIPEEILGHPVIGLCPECCGEGVLWAYEGDTHWADRCNFVTAWVIFWTFQRSGNANRRMMKFHFDLKMKATL